MRNSQRCEKKDHFKINWENRLKIVYAALSLLMLNLALMAQGGSMVIANDPTSNDEFGNAVDVQGQYMIVGAQRDRPSGSFSGSAYIFQWNGNAWTEMQKLGADNPGSYKRFGWSVAISGTYAAVGARGENTGGNNSGAAYIFQLNGNSWQQIDKVSEGSGAAEDDEFGQSIAMDGDVLVVGAWGDDGEQGAAYIYHRNGASWQLAERLDPAESGSGDFFGCSVAVSGNTVVVGAPGADVNGTGTGAVYVYERSGNTWTRTARFNGSNGGSGDAFGYSVALSGDRLIVGANAADFVAGDAGAAYLFTRSNGAWSESARFTDSNGLSGDEFGESVAIDGNLAMVGAHHNGVNGSDAGAAFLYQFDGNSWQPVSSVYPNAPMEGDRFGNAMVMRDGHAFVGAFRRDHSDKTDPGSIFFFQTPGVTAIDPLPGAVPTGFRLEPNFPNPFNPGTVIPFSLSRNEVVSLRIFNLLGQEMAVLIDGETMASGTYHISWDAQAFPAGVYFCQLNAGNQVATRRMLYVK